jgi:uncharacterized damage-inducible protein DinB
MVITDVQRIDPDRVAGERTMLEAWLDYHRATLLRKCADLTEEQLKRRPCEPSTLSLLGLVRHMTEVDSGWFAGFTGEPQVPRYYSDERPNDDFDDLDSAPVDEVFAGFDEVCERSRHGVAGVDLDEIRSRPRGDYSLRWVYLHLIEEYARHNGHADLLRERIDGEVGD